VWFPRSGDIERAGSRSEWIARESSEEQHEASAGTVFGTWDVVETIWIGGIESGLSFMMRFEVGICEITLHAIVAEVWICELTLHAIVAAEIFVGWY
jgi:hypothetical protein